MRAGSVVGLHGTGKYRQTGVGNESGVLNCVYIATVCHGGLLWPERRKNMMGGVRRVAVRSGE